MTEEMTNDYLNQPKSTSGIIWSLVQQDGKQQLFILVRTFKRPNRNILTVEDPIEYARMLVKLKLITKSV